MHRVVRPALTLLVLLTAHDRRGLAARHRDHPTSLFRA